MAATQENIQQKTIVVGSFLGFSDSWNFMQNDTTFVLPEKVEIQQKSNSYRGMAITEGVETVIEIQLGNYLDLPVSQVVLSTTTSHLSLTYIQKQFIAAIDEALETLHGRETYILWKRGCCATYAEALNCRQCGKIEEETPDGASQSNIESNTDDAGTFSDDDTNASSCTFVVTRRTIYPNDIYVFGSAFNENFRRRMQEMEDGCKTFTTLVNRNKNLDLDAAKKFFKRIKLEDFSEVAIRFAREFSSKGYALFWDRQAVTDYIKAEPLEEFYPGLLNRLGNFEYTLKPKLDDDIRIIAAKFRSGLFSWNDSIDEDEIEDLFSRPLIAEFLTGKFDNNLEAWRDVECGTGTRWLELFKRLLDLQKNKQNRIARFEGTVVTQNCKKSTPQEMIIKFNDTFGRDIVKLIEAHTKDNIQMFLVSCLMYPYRTLEGFVNKKLNPVQPENAYAPSLDDIKLASLCEAILYFGMHGTACQRHPDQLCCDLGLLKYTFRGGRSFFGLRNLSNARTLAGKVVMIDSTSVPLYVKVFAFVNDKDETCMNRYLGNIKNAIDIGENCEKMAKVFWCAVKNFVLETFSSENQRSISLYEIGETIKERDEVIKPMSASELMQFLNSPQCPNLLICNRFLKIVQKSMTEEDYGRFIEACALYIENKLYYEVTLLLFPVRSLCFDIVILPIRKTERFSFESMNENARDYIFGHYEKVFEKLYKKTFPLLRESLIQMQNRNGNGGVSLPLTFDLLNIRCNGYNDYDEDNDL